MAQLMILMLLGAGGPAESDQGTADKTRQAQPLSGKQSQQALAQARMHNPLRRHTFSAGDGTAQEPVQGVVQLKPSQQWNMGLRLPRMLQHA